ncbi:MAG: cyclic nucleotide-binding domain-containing protein [Chitinivibrionales bacterium]
MSGTGEKMEKLRQVSLFKDVKEDYNAMYKIAGCFNDIRKSAGEDVIKEGEEKGDSLYVINRGRVEILKTTLRKEPYTVFIMTGEENGFFGEVGLLDPDKRSATVRCIDDCEFYVLNRDNFESFGDEFPEAGLTLTRELSRIVCRRLRKANSDIITLFGALVNEVEEAGGIEEK